MITKSFIVCFIGMICVLGYGIFTLNDVTSSVDCLRIPEDTIIQNGMIDPLVVNPIDDIKSLREVCFDQ